MPDPDDTDAARASSDERAIDARVEYILATLDPPQGGAVLHVGCGDGSMLARMKKLRPDLECHGVVDSDAALGEYDRVFSYRTLEHTRAEELVDLFSVLGGHLKANGVMWHLSVPDARKRWQLWLEDWQNHNNGGAMPDAIKATRLFLVHLARLVKDDRRFDDEGTSYFHDHGKLLRSAGEAYAVKVFRPSDVWYRFDARITRRG